MGLSRRRFLKSGLGGAGGWLASGGAPAGAAAPATGAGPASPELRERLAIVNADDLGMSEEIDRGVFEAHDRGIVTSASLIVDGAHAAEAVRLAKQRPDLSVGIHVAFDERGRSFVDIEDPGAIQREIARQLDTFVRITGSPPTHIDSHHHVHRRFNVARHFLDVGVRLGVPVRGFSEVYYVGNFWGQPEWGHTDISRVSVGSLLTILESLRPGVSEVSCHPGHLEHRADAFYNREREIELRSLTSGQVKAVLAAKGIHLISFRDYDHAVAHSGGRTVASGCPPTLSSR
jgi:predicted glycoside hydrolase/deacetylase ChbG (UPF0249 family)